MVLSVTCVFAAGAYIEMMFSSMCNVSGCRESKKRMVQISKAALTSIIHWLKFGFHTENVLCAYSKLFVHSKLLYKHAEQDQNTHGEGPALIFKEI